MMRFCPSRNIVVSGGTEPVPPCYQIHRIVMMSYSRPQAWSLVVLCALAACAHDTTAPSNHPPAHLDAVADLSRTGVVGTAVAGGIVVKVTDASGRPVQ